MPAMPDLSRTFHAYGAATDTPAQLTALLGSDAAAREEALDHLQETILNDRTVYPSTAPVVRYVVAALPAATTQRTLEDLGAPLIGWLGDVGEVARAWEIPAKDTVVDPVEEQQLLAELATLGAAAELGGEWTDLPAHDPMMARGMVDLQSCADGVVAALVDVADEQDAIEGDGAPLLPVLVWALGQWLPLVTDTEVRDAARARLRQARRVAGDRDMVDLIEDFLDEG